MSDRLASSSGADNSLAVGAERRRLAHLLRAGHIEQAIDLAERILTREPGLAEVWLDLGMCWLRRGDYSKAGRCLEQVRSLGMATADCLVNLGACLLKEQRPDKALAVYAQAIAAHPGHAAAHNNRGNVLRQLARPEEALLDYDMAVARRVDYVHAWHGRGLTLLALGRRAEALASFRRAVTLQPDHAEALFQMGSLLVDVGDPLLARECMDRYLVLRPGDLAGYCNRGNIRFVLGDFDGAAADYRVVLDQEPDFPYLWGQYLYALMSSCSWEEYGPTCARIGGGLAAGRRVSPPFALLAGPFDAEQQLECARIFARDKYPTSSGVLSNVKGAGERIRIGYFSGDFHEHATSQLMAGMLELHDRSQFEVHAFSFGPRRDDGMRRRLLGAFEVFHEVGDLGDEGVVELARALGIDIAVDLKGCTGLARPGIFCRRAAPVQVAYLGYPGTSGIDAIDFIIADSIVIPSGAEQHYSEQVVRLPNSYQVNDVQKPIGTMCPTRREAGLPEEGFVYCCFNSNYKITPDLFDIWMQVLRQVDGSVLWLLAGNSRQAMDNLRREAVRRGVAADRLVFAQRAPLPEHLARHRLADLFLDTFYYNAHTTASDALWAGLPVLTCPGESFASRVGASLLTALGLPEMIAATHQEYGALAVALAQDPVRRKAVKCKLAANRLTHPLFDTPRTTRDIEAVYRELWQRYRSGI